MEAQNALNEVGDVKKIYSYNEHSDQNCKHINPEDNSVYISKQALQSDSEYSDNSTEESEQLIKSICEQNEVSYDEFKNVISDYLQNSFVETDDNNNSNEEKLKCRTNLAVTNISLKDKFLEEKHKRQLFLQQKSPLQKSLLKNQNCKSNSFLKSQSSVFNSSDGQNEPSFMAPTVSSENRSVRKNLDAISEQILQISNTSTLPESCIDREIHQNQTYNMGTPRAKYESSNDVINISSLDAVFEVKGNCNKLRKIKQFTSPERKKDEILFSMKKLQSENWDTALQGLIEIVYLTQSEATRRTLLSEMDSVYRKLIDLLQSSRKYVRKIACQLSGKLFEAMKCVKRPEFDDVVNILLHRTGDSDKTIRENANVSLDIMITHIPIVHSIRAICNKGPFHRNLLVHIATIRLVVCIVVLAGPNAILNEHLETRRSVLRCLPIYLNDNQREARNYGIRLYKLLLSCPNFDAHLKSALDLNTRTKLELIIKRNLK